MMFLLLLNAFAAGKCEWHLTLEAKIQERRAEIARELDDAFGAAKHGLEDQARFEVAKLLDSFREAPIQGLSRAEAALAETENELSELSKEMTERERAIADLELLNKKWSARVDEHGPGIRRWLRTDYWFARSMRSRVHEALARELRTLDVYREVQLIKTDTANNIRQNIARWRTLIEQQTAIATALAGDGRDLARRTLGSELARVTRGAQEFPEFARAEALMAALLNTNHGGALAMHRDALAIVEAAFSRLKGALSGTESDLVSALREFDPHCEWLDLPSVSTAGLNRQRLDAAVSFIGTKLEQKRAEIEAESARLVRETLSSVDVNLDPPN